VTTAWPAGWLLVPPLERAPLACVPCKHVHGRQTHFAASGNVGAVAAKEEVWEVSAQLAGYGLSVLLLNELQDAGALWHKAGAVTVAAATVAGGGRRAPAVGAVHAPDVHAPPCSLVVRLPARRQLADGGGHLGGGAGRARGAALHRPAAAAL
jgi:hypothetical protein